LQLHPDRQRLIPEIDLANPISLREITRTATRELEREIMLKVLQANGWSRMKTAKWLNISYRSLLYKLQESLVRGLERKLPESENSVPAAKRA
jgi:two-component system response regulator AtoC